MDGIARNHSRSKGVGGNLSSKGGRHFPALLSNPQELLLFDWRIFMDSSPGSKCCSAKSERLLGSGPLRSILDLLPTPHLTQVSASSLLNLGISSPWNYLAKNTDP